MMLGDVSGASRHVPVHVDAVHMFAFRFDGFLVIASYCRFGWCGSPAFYSLAGSIINSLYESSSPTSDAPIVNSNFVWKVWCNDHTCVEIGTESGCNDANIVLRRSMI